MRAGPSEILRRSLVLAVVAGAFGMSGCQDIQTVSLGGGYRLFRFRSGHTSAIAAPSGPVIVPWNKSAEDHHTIRRLAVSGDYVVGECADVETGESLGYFVLRTRPYGLKYGLSKMEWDAALTERGISTDIALQDAYSLPIASPSSIK